MHAGLLEDYKKHELFVIHKRAELLLSLEGDSEHVRQAKVSLELSGEVKKLADLEASVDDWRLLTELARADWEFALAKRTVQAKMQTDVRAAGLAA